MAMLAFPTIRAMGVEKDLLKPGTGPKPLAGQNVTVHCTGFGKNGDLTKKFWSTKDPGQKPFSFQIGQGNVIKGWRIQNSQIERYQAVGAFVMVYIDVIICTIVGFWYSIAQGWDEGVLGMQVGEVARLRCTPDYAYGPNGFPAWGIQPNADLVFEIQVLSVE